MLAPTPTNLLRIQKSGTMAAMTAMPAMMNTIFPALGLGIIKGILIRSSNQNQQSTKLLYYDYALAASKMSQISTIDTFFLSQLLKPPKKEKKKYYAPPPPSYGYGYQVSLAICWKLVLAQNIDYTNFRTTRMLTPMVDTTIMPGISYQDLNLL